MHDSCVAQPFTIKFWQPTPKAQKIYERMVADTKNAWIECVQFVIEIVYHNRVWFCRVRDVKAVNYENKVSVMARCTTC